MSGPGKGLHSQSAFLVCFALIPILMLLQEVIMSMTPN